MSTLEIIVCSILYAAVSAVVIWGEIKTRNTPSPVSRIITWGIILMVAIPMVLFFPKDTDAGMWARIMLVPYGLILTFITRLIIKLIMKLRGEA